MKATHTIRSFAPALVLTIFAWVSPAQSQDVVVFAIIDEGIAWLKQENF